MHTSSIAYHQGELEVALDARNPHRLVPQPGDATAILDIGCGAGQTLVAIGAVGRGVGVDIDVAALRVAARGPIGQPLKVAAAQGEHLPFAASAFDYVYSRVALPYMNIPVALAEMARVLQPEGHLWLALHPIDIPAPFADTPVTHIPADAGGGWHLTLLRHLKQAGMDVDLNKLC